MKRRTLLGTLGTTGIVTLTGCLSDGGGGTPSDNGTATDTPTPMPTPAPTLTGSGFQVDSPQSGTQADSATATVDGTDVVVDGRIQGDNGCYTGELDSVNYDGDRLTVAVRAVDDSDPDEMCTDAIVEIDYTATVEFANGPPATVVVTHDHGDGPETVLTTSP